MPRSHTFLIGWMAAILMCPAPLEAQSGKERFLRGLEEFSNAVAGAHGDEGPVLLAAVVQMRSGLEEWDAQIAAIESRFKAEVDAAPAAAAARMRAALGTVYLERGRVADAIAQLDAAPRLDGSFTEVHVLRGLAYEAANRAAEAADAYRSLVQREFSDPAEAYLYLRAVAEADTSLRATAARRALLTAVERGTSKGGPLFPTAEPIDDAAVAAPIFPPAAYADAFALLRTRRYDAAVASLAAAVEADPLVTDPGLTDPAVRDAIAALKAPGSSAPLTSLDAAAARLGSGEVYRAAGMACWDRKQYPESLERLRQAVRLNPLDERARVAIADVLVESGEPAAARDALRDTTRALPQSGRAHWTLGRLAQLMGDEVEALRALEAASALAPIAGASHLRAAVGRLHHNHLDLDAAAAAYSTRLRLTPNDGAAHADLGDVYRSQGALGRAMTEFLMAALLDPSSARAFASIGQLHAVEGRDEAAVAVLRRAVTLDASHLEARYALSRALLRLGRADEAQRELEIYEQLQAKAMEEERRRFKDNQTKIDEALKAAEPEEPVR